MIVYIAGKITGLLDYKSKFEIAEKMLQKSGHIVINPSILPAGLNDYLGICFAMIDECDAVYLLVDYTDSPGAMLERDYAKDEGKIIW